MTTKDDVIRGQEWAGMALVRENERLRAEVERDERRFRETEAEWVDRFQALEAEVEQLRSLKAGTVTVELANGLFGSDKYVPEQRARGLEAEIERLRAALEGVIAEADRKTAAFDRAHAALARHKK